MKKDTFRIYLCSEDNTTEDEANGTYTFDVRLPAKQNTYTGYTLYVDDFNVCLKGLSITSVLVKLNMGEYNSYNSQTGGNNNTIATIYPPNQASDRTADLSLLYQASTTPYNISTLPNTMTIRITNIDNTGINFSSANNFWTLNLRVDAHLPCPCE